MVRVATLVLRPAAPCLRTRRATQSSDRAARTSEADHCRKEVLGNRCLRWPDVAKLTRFGV